MSAQNPNQATDEWSEEIKRGKKEGKYPKWPDEVMPKILFRCIDYMKSLFRPQPEWRVLDVGFGFAKNLVLLCR